MSPDGKFAHDVLGRLSRDSPGVLSEQTDNASRLSGAWQQRSRSRFRTSRGARCRRVSNRQMPVATDTLSEATRARAAGCRRCGRTARASAGAGPMPSAPSTQASGPDKSASNRLSAPPASAPTSHTPRSLSSRSVRARLVTAITGTVSAAPDAALATVALTPDRAILRHDHRVRAERVGAAQARAQVVRIGDAVEHEQQRRLVETRRARRRACDTAASRRLRRRRPGAGRCRRSRRAACRRPDARQRRRFRRARSARAHDGRGARRRRRARARFPDAGASAR